MTKRTKRVPIETKTTVADAVSAAFGDLQGLGEELRDIVDNAPDNLRNSAVNEARDEAASALEGLNEPDVPEKLGVMEIKYSSMPMKARASRSDRCQDACFVLDQVVQFLEGLELADSGDEVDRDELVSAIGDVKDEAEQVSFPGMYG